ncbi:MAG TPA: hypothetical protein VN814_17330 [Caulobacteraceae bacterium]|nr:hypothetical protein [Caulobacteraceae bacterium]
MRNTLLVAAAFASVACAAAARPGDADHPIALKMKRGTDSIVVHGVLRQNVDCCAYTFKAHAGQQLHWSETGAVARVGIAYPDGDGINPGLPNPADLPQDGRYVLTLSPDLMAEGAFGPFTLKVRIPPAP